MPYSSPLLLLLLILGYAIDNLRVNLLLPGVTVGQLAGILLLHTLLMLSITAALLTMFGYRARIVQTLTALTGTGVILSLLMLPLDYITRLNPQNFTMASLIIMAMQIWSLVIVGHILSCPVGSSADRCYHCYWLSDSGVGGIQHTAARGELNLIRNTLGHACTFTFSVFAAHLWVVLLFWPVSWATR